MEERLGIAQFLKLKSEAYSGNWSVVQGFDGYALDRKIHVAGWNFFFMAAEVKVMFFGRPGTTKIRNAVRRILAKLKPQSFNCLEVTGIKKKRFWGLRYATVSAHGLRSTGSWARTIWKLPCMTQRLAAAETAYTRNA